MSRAGEKLYATTRRELSDRRYRIGFAAFAGMLAIYLVLVVWA